VGGLHLVLEHREGLPRLCLGGDRLGPGHLGVVDHGQAEGLVVGQDVLDHLVEEMDLVVVLVGDEDLLGDAVHGEELAVPFGDGSAGGSGVAVVLEGAGGGVLGDHDNSWVGDAVAGVYSAVDGKDSSQ